MMEDEICGREIISTYIKHGILNPGNLTFITGGRSVGKSKILKSIVKEIGESQRIPVGEVTKPPKKKVSVVMMDGRGLFFEQVGDQRSHATSHLLFAYRVRR